MKFGIAGPVSKDHLILPSGKILTQFGGIAYPALALAELIGGQPDLVVCLSHVSASDAAKVQELFCHPKIRLITGSQPAEGSEIELLRLDEEERASRQIRVMTPISPAEMEFLADCDFVLLLPLAETDIPRESAEALRRCSRAMIFLDAHGLITRVQADGARQKIIWEDAAAWLDLIDILKMNDREVPWASGKALDSSHDSCVKYATRVIRQGLSVAWITCGSRPSVVAWQRDERIFWADVPVPAVRDVVDTTGCGDTASGGFMYSYAKLRNPLFAVIRGNTLGSLKASAHETGEFLNRPEVRGFFPLYRDYLHTALDDFLAQSHLIIHEAKKEAETVNEGSVHSANGRRDDHGPDDARRGDREGTAAPWP